MPFRRTLWYSVDSDGDQRFSIIVTTYHMEDVAVDAAEDYHSNHDGWESHWPLDIVIYESENGPAVARFEVEREMAPEFSARERSLEPPAPPPVSPAQEPT